MVFEPVSLELLEIILRGIESEMETSPFGSQNAKNC